VNSFPFPAEPSERQNAIESAIGRWLVVLLPLIIIGHLLGALTIAAAFISANYNVMSWLE
jgi:hypothetical protein